MKKINYYYIIGSQKFLLQQEPLEEVLRERTKNYNKRKRCLDFWVLLNPKFLFSVKSKKIKEKCPENPIAIISTNKIFTIWLKLRFQNVVWGKFTSIESVSPLEYEK
uniref:Ycf54 n=1 Tax=Fibrocapsa japonica TaxID=94617 RepID=UPI002115B4B9|nr:Ycf54 [Fibrocapsa japonica]UTE95103.1 Ycf54 [Fibrocapsa japonica]